VASIVEGPWHYWTLHVTWTPAPGADEGRPLRIVDSTQSMAILSPSDSQISIDPLTPTEAWLLLTMILPDDDEIAATSDGAEG